MVHRLSAQLDVTHEAAERLVDVGFHSPEGILEAEQAYFQVTTGFDEETVESIYAHAQAIVDAKGE